MIQIDISKKLGDIRKIYEGPRRTNNTSVVKALTKKISKQIDKNSNNAERIVGEFLKKWFVKNGKVTEKAVIEYLLSSNLD